jgi:hypothetical protein
LKNECIDRWFGCILSEWEEARVEAKPKVVRAGAKGFTPQQQQQQPQVSLQAQQQPAQGISEHMPDSLPDQVMTDEVKDCD